MELLQLKYFCDAAKLENFSKTARKYTVPPSNISQSIKRLEAELGINLFVRGANKIVLSDEGVNFYKRISKALALINEATAEFKDDGTSGTINISINSNRRMVMEAIEEYKANFPNVNIQTAYFGNLDTEDYHIVIDGENSTLTTFEKEKLLSEDIALAVNVASPLAKTEKISIDSLRNEAFITMDRKSSMYKVTHDICNAHGFSPKIALQSDDPSFVRKCVELGLGIAFAPTLSWKGQFQDSVILKDIDHKRDIFIYKNSKIRIPLCTNNFVTLLKEKIISRNM